MTTAKISPNVMPNDHDNTDGRSKPSQSPSVHDADNDQVDRVMPITTFPERLRRWKSPEYSPRCSSKVKDDPIHIRGRRGRSLAPRTLTISRIPVLAHSPRKFEPPVDQRLQELVHPVIAVDNASIYNAVDQRRRRINPVTEIEIGQDSKIDTLMNVSVAGENDSNAEIERKASDLPHAQPASSEDVLAAISRYDVRWKRLSARPTKFPLNFTNVPWPLFVPPSSAADISVDSITEFILHPFRVGDTSETKRRLLEDESRIWDPEHVEHVILIAIRDPSERMHVKDKAASIFETIRRLM